MDPRETSDVQATGTLPLSGQSSVPVQAPAAVERERPAWLVQARDGLTQPGKYLAFEESGRQVVTPLN
jgi:ureidoglycolate hydrolase